MSFCESKMLPFKCIICCMFHGRFNYKKSYWQLRIILYAIVSNALFKCHDRCIKRLLNSQLLTGMTHLEIMKNAQVLFYTYRSCYCFTHTVVNHASKFEKIKRRTTSKTKTKTVLIYCHYLVHSFERLHIHELSRYIFKSCKTGFKCGNNYCFVLRYTFVCIDVIT